MQNYTCMPQGMLHDTLSQEFLQNIIVKEREIPPHIAPRTNAYIDDTNKTTAGDKYY